MSSNNNNTKSKLAWRVKEPTKLEDAFPLQRLSLRADDFDRLILQQGTRVKVYRTMFCPNVKSIDGAEHQIDCEIVGCNGSGYVDKYPICTTAFIQTQSLEKLVDVAGLADQNSVTSTFLTGIELQYFTLVELVDFTEIYFQRIKRDGSRAFDALKYNAKRINVILDQNDVEYFEGIDCNIDINGNIVWVTSRGPADDVIYSIHYEAPVQFRAVRSMHTNRFTQVKDAADAGKIAFVKMPEQWLLVKEFLVKRKDIDGNEILPNKIIIPEGD